MGFIEVINTCDNFPQHDSGDKGPWNNAMSELWKFCLPGSPHTFGYLIPATVSRMPWTSEFHLDESTRTISLVPEDPRDFQVSGVSAMSKLLKAAQDSGLFIKLSKWPGEKFPVLGAPFPFAVDRAIAPYFGIVSTGVQLTAFVRGENKTPTGIWIARRGLEKPMYAGMLDNAVGGAVKHDETPFESISREAREELGIDANSAISGGTVSWFNIKEAKAGFDPGLVEPGIQYVYDLEVDSQTVLYPAEDGIDWLRLLTIDEIKSALFRFEFKPSSAYVMIDFLVRHGIVNAENEVEFPEIVSRLHRRLPSPVCSK